VIDRRAGALRYQIEIRLGVRQSLLNCLDCCPIREIETSRIIRDVLQAIELIEQHRAALGAEGQDILKMFDIYFVRRFRTLCDRDGRKGYLVGGRHGSVAGPSVTVTA